MARTDYSLRRLSWPIVLVILLMTNGGVASTVTTTVSNWLENPGYDNGGTIQEQIRCYALPFGAIGFASHMLTYLTVLCFAAGRSPWCPWRRLGWRTFNLVVGIVGLAISLPLTVLVMVRCRNSRSFILIAVWKLTLSVTLSFMTIHAARIIDPRTSPSRSRDDEDAKALLGQPQAHLAGLEPASSEKSQVPHPSSKKFRKIMWWSILYFLGALVGLVGVANLVRLHFAEIWQLRTITYVFVCVLVGVPLLAMLIFFCGCGSGSGGARTGFIVAASGLGYTVFVAFVLLTALIALYTDWVLAALAGDWVGWPSSENAVFYWSYFAAKRLPIVSL